GRRRADRGGGPPPPFDKGQRKKNRSDDEQTDHNHRLDGAIMLIGIPSGDEFDPVGANRGNQRQNSRQGGQCRQDPEPPTKSRIHLTLPSRTDEQVSERGSSKSIL